MSTHRTTQKHVEHHEATEIMSYRLGTVNAFHWECKPVFSYSKPHTFSTIFGEDKENNNKH